MIDVIREGIGDLLGARRLKLSGADKAEPDASEDASLELPTHWMWWPMLTACVEVAKRFHAAETEFGKFVLNLRHDMKAVEALELPVDDQSSGGADQQAQD